MVVETIGEVMVVVVKVVNRVERMVEEMVGRDNQEGGNKSDGMVDTLEDMVNVFDDMNSKMS